MGHIDAKMIPNDSTPMWHFTGFYGEKTGNLMRTNAQIIVFKDTFLDCGLQDLVQNRPKRFEPNSLIFVCL